MPREYRLKQRIAELNKQWNISSTPNGVCGVQQSLEDSLRVRIAHLHQKAPPDAVFRRTKTVNVKLSGDGTNIGKRLHVINFTFTLLEEGWLAYSSEGNHTLAILKEPEKYQSQKDALEDICDEVKRLEEITVDGHTYKINFYLGGEWKFLALITGIDSASSQYPCMWCKCSTDERRDVDKHWSITDPTLGARTIEENVKVSQLPKSKRKHNVSRLPLFPTIPLQNVVIDNLHLLLRVSDILIDLMIVELRRMDLIEKRKLTDFDPQKCKNLDRFQRFITSLGIPGYNFWVGKQSKELKWRTLTGPEKLTLFRTLIFKTCCPTLLKPLL